MLTTFLTRAMGRLINIGGPQNVVNKPNKYLALWAAWEALLRVAIYILSISVEQSVRSKRNNQRVGRIQNSDFSTSFCFYSNLIFNNLKWMKPFLLFHLWPSALKYIKQMKKKKIFCKSYLAAKLTYTKIFPNLFQLRC